MSLPTPSYLLDSVQGNISAASLTTTNLLLDTPRTPGFTLSLEVLCSATLWAKMFALMAQEVEVGAKS